ncbi:MAG: CvpA family protein [Treponema sp.]|jgi:uncharacterized membrane protein required for colicin V production|nr:CvpA family protein [Treponema sp.]
MNLSALDLFFLILLILLVPRGFLKGFTGEFFSIASLALGVIAALFLFKNGAALLRARFFPGLAVVPEILSFAGIFTAVFLAGKILGRFAADIIAGMNLDKLDRALGLVLGAGEALALFSAVSLLLRVQPLFDAGDLLEKSVFARLLLPLIGGFHV